MTGHHTQDQARLAFIAAQDILRELEERFPAEAGSAYSVTLCSDGSGFIDLGREPVRSELVGFACGLVRSNRLRLCDCMFSKSPDPKHKCRVQISSCCGFVTHATEKGLGTSRPLRLHDEKEILAIAWRVTEHGESDWNPRDNTVVDAVVAGIERSQAILRRKNGDLSE